MPIPDPRGSKPPGYLPATTQRPGSRGGAATIVTPVGASAGARMGLLKKRRSATPGGTAASQQKRSGGGAPVGGGTATTSASYGETTADRLIKDALSKLQTPGEVGGIYDKQAATVAQLGQTWQNLLAANGQLSQGLAQASQRAVVDEALKNANYGASGAVGIQNNGQGVAGSIGAGQAVADTAGANPGVFALSTRDAVAGLRATAPLVVQDRQALVEGKRQSALADLAKQRGAVESTRSETALKINQQYQSDLATARKESNDYKLSLMALGVKEKAAQLQADTALAKSEADLKFRYAHDATMVDVANARNQTTVDVANARNQTTITAAKLRKAASGQGTIGTGIRTSFLSALKNAGKAFAKPTGQTTQQYTYSYFIPASAAATTGNAYDPRKSGGTSSAQRITYVSDHPLTDAEKQQIVTVHNKVYTNGMNGWIGTPTVQSVPSAAPTADPQARFRAALGTLEAWNAAYADSTGKSPFSEQQLIQYLRKQTGFYPTAPTRPAKGTGKRGGR